MTREEYLKLEKEAQEKFEKMTPEEKESFLAARKRHQRKVRVEMLGYDKHPDEKKEDVFKDDKKDDTENQSD
ncbi:hypothetical protein ACE1MK_08725 [Tenacibaculum maritimum]|uniref:hypothetical protein n=1 Tax=Tenacibaculum maritimum TaxID=107401 RepID=UPI0012E4CAB4|nr:hypothetical protein [Tenacibaculum maritimum]CAA0175380.1 hypothetical protein TMP248_150001 [Tenacibaculum maritimum]CAA0253197.1 hypothetical protein USCSP91_700002 [Tenacibaculum maritimum]